MILFTCKKYDFLIEKTLPSFPAYFATRRKRNSQGTAERRERLSTELRKKAPRRKRNSQRTAERRERLSTQLRKKAPRGKRNRVILPTTQNQGKLRQELAFIFGVLLFRAEPRRSWHIVAVAIQHFIRNCEYSYVGNFYRCEQSADGATKLRRCTGFLYFFNCLPSSILRKRIEFDFLPRRWRAGGLPYVVEYRFRFF